MEVKGDTMHQITSIVPVAATGRGDIDGFEAVCSCGDRVGSSLITLARQWGREHAEYMNRKEAS